MFLDIGGNTIVLSKEIISILDASTKENKVNREFINFARLDRKVIYIVPSGQEKSYVITDKAIYFSPYTPATIMRRANQYHLK